MKFYLIQRGKINKGNAFNGVTGREGFANLDYMGSAEFEWGAIPKAYRRIMGQFEQYSLSETGLKTSNGVPLQIFCRADMCDEIVAEIKAYIQEPYRLKEYSALAEHFKSNLLDNSKWARDNTNFWWDIRNDWIAFIGASDRARIFRETIEKDYHDWWLAKDEATREAETQKAFER